MIEGAPASFKNSKRLVTLKNGRRLALKSKAATSWLSSAVLQLRAQRGRAATITGPVAISLWIFRARNTGDWDNLAGGVGDALEDAGVIANDKQITEAHVVLGLDRARPRIEVELRAATQEAA